MLSKKVRRLLHRRLFFDLLINKSEQSSSDIYYVNVDPAQVSHISLMPGNACSLSGSKAWHGSFKGCFDMIKVPFKKDFMYQTVEQLLHKEDWETTPYYKKLLKYKTHNETLAHYKKLQRLIKIIVTDGYLSQYELGRADLTANISKWEVPQHEIVIGMDRWGQLFRIEGGRHRLAIAQNVGIKNIPAILMLYHHDAINYLPKKRRVIQGNRDDFRPFERARKHREVVGI